jgi:hypothetical protein
MKEYEIRITETLVMAIKVKADNAARAREIVERGYKDSEYILDADHFQGVTFTAPKNRDYER